ncbi:MAG: tryptophan-rich sensory protein [Candidatus Marinimicrobia bacterium]|nr:tryptophan-rich sensory protein [Candidatus Neomarinimicrobiota bacterium]
MGYVGIAFFVVWQNKAEILFRLDLLIYTIQLVLNLLWSFFFFTLKSL